VYFALGLVLLASGATRVVERLARQYFANDYVVLLAFTAAFGLAETILTLPLQYYSGFYLEHKYNLSNQTIWRWIWEGLKGLLVSIPIATPSSLRSSTV